MKLAVWIKHAAQLVTLAQTTEGPRIKEAMNDLSIIEDGSVWIENGIIQAIGTTEELEKQFGDRVLEADITDATGHLVTPGLVDPHTHVAYGGRRAREFEMRRECATYMEITTAGGGMHATTKMTQEATEEEPIEQTRRRLDSMWKQRVYKVDAKSRQ